MHPVQKWQYVLISGWKRCLGQTRALCWKLLISGVHSAKMRKRSDLRLITLFWTNSCTLLKKAKTCCTQCENDKTCWSGANNAVSLCGPTLCPLLKRVKKWCTQCKNDSACWSRAENAALYKLLHFAENAKKWCAQSENDKTCWSRAENAV